MNITERLNTFINNTIGNFQEVSYKDAIYQCMDLVYEWVFVLGYPKSTIQHTYAYQVFKNPNSNTKDYFDIIPNSDTFIPQDGDIGVFTGGEAGHIVVCLSGGTVTTFKAYSQNDPLGTNPVIKTYKYTNFLGVLRPKVDIQQAGEYVLKEQFFKDARTALCGEYSEDEIKADQEHNRNMLDQITDLCKNDTKFYNKWIKPNIPEVSTPPVETTPDTSSDTNTPDTECEGDKTVEEVHDVLYGKGWWWDKWAKIKSIIPK